MILGSATTGNSLKISTVSIAILTILLLFVPPSSLPLHALASTSGQFGFDDFNGNQLLPQWTYVHAGSSNTQLSVNNGILRLTGGGSGGASSDDFQIATPFTPSTDSFEITARVRAHSFGRFHVILASQPGIFDVLPTAAFELDLTGNLPSDCGNRGAAINRTASSYAVFYCSPITETWYRLQIVATRSPWIVTWNLMSDNGSLIATSSATNPHYTYDGIQYLALGVWCGWDGCLSDYDVDWISSNSAPAVPGFQRMYLLNITSVYSVVDTFSQQWAGNLSRSIAELANRRGYSLTIINTFDEWNNLLRQPPQGITVFSAHWNWMLIPKSWQNVTWQQFYVSVANIVYSRGWIVHSSDWPYYTYYREGDTGGTFAGTTGTGTFLSVIHASMDAWSDTISPDTSTITTDGTRAATAANLDLPGSMNGPGVFNHRAVLWSGTSPVMSFYQTAPWNGGVRYPASAIRMGFGFFVHVQWTENLTLHAEMVFAFATMLTYDLAFRFDWADFNNDGQVNILDVAATAICFDTTNASATWPICKYWDLNSQNKISIVDLATVAILFGQQSSGNPYPGQGLSPGQLDPFWSISGECDNLSGVDHDYCLANV